MLKLYLCGVSVALHCQLPPQQKSSRFYMNFGELYLPSHCEDSTYCGWSLGLVVLNLDRIISHRQPTSDLAYLAMVSSGLQPLNMRGYVRRIEWHIRLVLALCDWFLEKIHRRRVGEQSVVHTRSLLSSSPEIDCWCKIPLSVYRLYASSQLEPDVCCRLGCFGET